MEFIIILVLIIVSYIFLKFIYRVLYRIQHPPFDYEKYNRYMLDTLKKYKEKEGPSKVELLKKSFAELKREQEVRRAIESELNVKM